MFLVKDSISERHRKIRSMNPFAGVILAAADFEWTVRRAILALGTQPTKVIRESLGQASGLDKYKKVWADEVFPRTGKRLPDVIPGWDFFKKDAYKLRHRLVHGAKGTVGEDFARERQECILAASRALNDFAQEQGEPLYGRAIRRLNPRKNRRNKQKNVRLPHKKPDTGC